MYLEYHTVVVLFFFWFWREIVFGVTYVLSVQYSCAVVSVFLLWRESFITTGKKSSSRLSGGCVIVITTGKKSSSRDCYYDRKKKVLVICLVGARSLLRPEKKSSSRDFYAKLNVSNLNVMNLY
jgi:hypothetical protein